MLYRNQSIQPLSVLERGELTYQGSPSRLCIDNPLLCWVLTVVGILTVKLHESSHAHGNSEVQLVKVDDSSRFVLAYEWTRGDEDSRILLNLQSWRFSARCPVEQCSGGRSPDMFAMRVCRTAASEQAETHLLCMPRRLRRQYGTV